MQNKGFVKLIAVLLVLICLYYFSFSFVTRHYEKKAAKMEAKAGEFYLDSLKNETVWMGKTFKECQTQQIGLGLDLKGGMNVILEVSVPDVIRTLADHSEDAQFNQAVNEATAEAKKSQSDFITLFVKRYQELAGKDKLCSVFATQQLKGKVATNSTDRQVEEVLRTEVKSAVDNAHNVISSRINKFGVAQPNIQSLEGQMGRIMVEMPGIKEPDRVRKLLQGSANLEFWETYDASEIVPLLTLLDSKLAAANVGQTDSTKTEAAAETAPTTETAAADTAKAAAESGFTSRLGGDKQSAKTNASASAETKKQHPLASILEFVPAQSSGSMVGMALTRDTAEVMQLVKSAVAKTLLPANLSLKWGVKPSDRTKVECYELYAIRTSGNKGKAPLEGSVITSANAAFDQYNRPQVEMAMNPEGARIWAALTKKNVNHAIAIVLDDVVYSAPNVMNEITGGRSQITGNFTTEDTKDLSNVLNSGKMPAPAHIVQEEIVGPSLGQESINQGIMSFIIAFILLMCYMCMVYGFRPGMVANFALLLNFFITLGVLTSFQAALTMSGIAGMVLTLGMAVDANVLIFERTKEELAAGKQLKSALKDGYGNAFSAIIDSNVTSIITGIILFYFGTGPIRGFATTLIIGLLASLFTAVFITRIIFEHFLNKDKWTDMTFTTAVSRNWMKNPKFRFMSAYKVSFIIFAAGLIISFASFGLRGLAQGIDFSGGRNFVVQFEDKVQPETVTKLLQGEMGDATVTCIALGTDGKTVRISTNYRIDEDDPNIDPEVEEFIFTALKKGQLLKDGVDLTKFVDRENRDGGSIISSQKVGPSIAKDVTRGAIISVILALIAIFIYILIRFRNVAFSIGSVVGLTCDAILIIGTYSLLWGRVPFSLEIDQTFIGAILTCIGYSINDKVVVFDRIREFLRLYPKRDRQLLFNQSLNTTLARTINTSVTTLIVLLCIFFLGGDSIRSFAFAMILGVVYGTCSSLFLAAPLAFLTLGRRIKENDAPVAEVEKK